MFEYLCNPSAAIKKRRALLNGKNDTAEQDDTAIHKLKTVAKCFSIVDTMTSENLMFHGSDSLENCIKVFAEYAVEKKEKHYQKCLEIIENKKEGDRIYTRGITKNAALFEDKGYSASKAIRASLLLCSVIENEKETKQAIQHSLECFRAVLGYEKIEDYAYQKNGKWIYREGKLFPDYYNLRILAFSSGWKNEETIRTVTESVNRLAMLQVDAMSSIENNAAFTKWGAYSGVSLEDNWLKKERRINDLAFRVGLINHYSLLFNTGC